MDIHWCPGVIDTNGDGQISTGWTEPREAIDPKRDHRIEFGCYSIGISPTDGSIWCSGIEHDLSTDMLYLTNIDHHDALGLGKDVVLGGDFNSDSFFVLRPQNGRMQTLTLRVPYPLGFSPRHVAGRIDDP